MTAQRGREAALAALFAKISAIPGWKNTPQRRLVLWDQCPPEQRPAFYQFEGGKQAYSWTIGALPARTLDVALVFYFNAADNPGGPQMAVVMDALDAALAGDPILGKQTLGGTCEYCRIGPDMLVEPGDIDNDGILWVPVQIKLP